MGAGLTALSVQTMWFLPIPALPPVEKIGKQPFYLCVAKERTDLLGELNMAVPIVNEQDAADLDELRSKYFTETTVSVFLSDFVSVKNGHF